MGRTCHHAVIVTGWSDKGLIEAHEKAKEIYSRLSDVHPNSVRLVSDIQQGLVNGYDTFTVAPDGGNEGRESSNRVNEARQEFVEWLRCATQFQLGRSKYLVLEWAEVEFGMEETRSARIVAHGGDDEEE